MIGGKLPKSKKFRTKDAIIVSSGSKTDQSQTSEGNLLVMMRKTEKKPINRFNEALASVLSVRPDTIQDALRDSKDEEPSPHKRYSYSPEEVET
jgi:hypothetical protein